MAAREIALKLVEESSGKGDVLWREHVFEGVDYRISRFQGMTHSGLPIPGLHRIEGNVNLAGVSQRAEMVDTIFKLRLEDGRMLGVTLSGEDGTLLAEGHGPSRCGCC